MEKHKNKKEKAMTEAMNLIFSLEFHSLQDPEIDLQKKLMGDWGKLRYVGFYSKARKHMTAILNKTNSPNIRFSELIMEIDKWSTLLTRIFDKTETASKILEKVKENITHHVEEESKIKRRPIDSKFKVNGLKFLCFCLDNYYLTMEYLNKNAIYSFATTTKTNKAGRVSIAV